MREKELPFDRTKHAVYTKNAEKCVQKLLHRYYDETTAAELPWSNFGEAPGSLIRRKGRPC